VKTSRRSQELTDFADYFLTAHEEWQSDTNRQHPDESYWDAVDELLEAFEAGDIPDECRVLAEAVDALAERTGEFYARTDQGRSDPGGAFWSALEAVKTARQPAKEEMLIPLETIKTLDKQGVPHGQIAMIYGLVPSGEELNANRYAHLVQKELDEPGSVIGPDWIDPRLRERQEKQSATQERHGRIQRKRAERAVEKPAPETIEELLLQGVSVEQICQMKHCGMEEVLAEQSRLDIEKAERKAKRQKAEAAA
jgi:hypothetical protein